MRRWRHSWLALLAALLAPAAVLAQPADLTIPAAKTTVYPDGISVSETPDGPVYSASDGRTLYGMDMRTVHRWAPDPAQYCETRCENWEPVLAPAGSEPNIMYPPGFGNQMRKAQAELAAKGYHAEPQNAPDWTIIEGPQGLQWVYKGWHMVYVRKGDRPGATDHDGADGYIWNTLKFVPPVPEIVAPDTVVPIFADGAYVLAAGEDRVLYSGRCATDCGKWEPLAAGLANRGMGDWTVDRTADTPQWVYRGKPVFVSQSADMSAIPAGAEALHP